MIVYRDMPSWRPRYVLMAAMLLLTPLLPLLWLLTTFLLVLGMAEGVVDVGGDTLLVWVHRHQVGPFMNGLHFFFGVGAFLSPIVIAQMVLMSGDIIWAYWALALLMLPVVVGLLRLPSPTASMTSPDRPGRARQPAADPLLRRSFSACGSKIQLWRVGVYLCSSLGAGQRDDCRLPYLGLLGSAQPWVACWRSRLPHASGLVHPALEPGGQPDPV